MSGTAEALEQHCRQVADSAVSAIQWLRAVGARIGKPIDQPERDLRDIGRRAERLRQVVNIPLNVGVFGSNQSGKSYFAAALARRGAAPLRIVLGSERVDYFARINPLRTPKSSACVTRFSLRGRDPGMPDLPVHITLLGQADIIRIIANSYLEDVDPSVAVPATPERIGAIVNRLRAQMGDVHPGMTAQDVGGTQSYLQRHFSTHPLVAGLGEDFWRAAVELSERLPVQGRAILFSVLWGETPQLTVLCVRLLQALDDLGNAENAFCGLDALDIQSGSILDVDTIMQGLEDDIAAKVGIGLPDGRRLEIARPVAAALIEELYLPLEEQGYGFLNNADLLDFPGAPARSRFTEPDSLFADPTNRARHYRRGKAAYLFQRYVATQQVAALVLCMEDTPPTARSLPAMVQDWIDTTMGASPDERRDLPCALFVALTKFDQDLKEELRQKEDDPEHWAARLRSVFDDFLCRDYNWSERWAPSRPFDNVYWLRNPVIAEPEVLQYNASGRETGLVDRGRIARLRGRFIATPAVRRHVADPGRAWDEVLKLNDGGISYIAGQLRTVCDPEQRRRQAAETLAIMAREMHQCLEPFYVAATPAKAAEPAAEPAAEAPAETTSAEPQAAAGHEPEEMAGEPAPHLEPTPSEDDTAHIPVIELPTQAAPSFGGPNVRLLAIAAVVVLAVIAGAYVLFSGSGEPNPAPAPSARSALAPAPSPAPAAAPQPVPTAPARSVQVPAPQPTPASGQQTTRCGPFEAPERMVALPGNVQASPADMVCVARAWIAVGRAGDAVFQLNQALQSSPNRVYGPAALELGRLYDPLYPKPNWPPNAAFAMEKYQDAANDPAFPDTQREAQTALDALRKATSTGR